MTPGIIWSNQCVIHMDSSRLSTKAGVWGGKATTFNSRPHHPQFGRTQHFDLAVLDFRPSCFLAAVVLVAVELDFVHPCHVAPGIRPKQILNQHIGRTRPGPVMAQYRDNSADFTVAFKNERRSSPFVNS